MGRTNKDVRVYEPPRSYSRVRVALPSIRGSGDPMCKGRREVNAIHVVTGRVKLLVQSLLSTRVEIIHSGTVCDNWSRKSEPCLDQGFCLSCPASRGFKLNIRLIPGGALKRAAARVRGDDGNRSSVQHKAAS